MFESLNDLVLSVLVLLVGGTLCVLIGKWLQIRAIMTVAIYAWHTLHAYLYSSYILTFGGDAFVYYQKARFDYVQPSLGTEFIVWVTSIPVSMGFTYSSLSFLYHTAGALGLLFFYAALRESAGESARSLPMRALILLCCFIPSLSFWTSGIGKDSVAFLCVGLFLWSTLNLGRRQVLAIVAVLIMMFVRPHVAVLMVISAAIGTMFVPRLRTSVRFGIAAIATAAAVFAVPMALVYSGSTRFGSIGEYIVERQEQNLQGGSSVDIIGMNPALRLLSFLYRPLPNETSGAAQLAASLDNVLLILLTALGIVAVFRAGFIRVFRNHGIALIYGLMTLVMLSQVTANLGLASRQKWMLIPALMIVLVGALAMARKDKADKRQLYPLPVTPRVMP